MNDCRRHIDNAFPTAMHDHRRCVKEALDRAGKLCRRQGSKLTDLRKRVLELVWSGHRPLGAYEILDILKLERHSAAPPTVYRTLEFLLDMGLVHRLESLNSYIGCRQPGTPHAGQFMICTTCGLSTEIDDQRIDMAIGESAAEIGFAIIQHTIEVKGTCPSCGEEQLGK